MTHLVFGGTYTPPAATAVLLDFLSPSHRSARWGYAHSNPVIIEVEEKSRMWISWIDLARRATVSSPTCAAPGLNERYASGSAQFSAASTHHIYAAMPEPVQCAVFMLSGRTFPVPISAAVYGSASDMSSGGSGTLLTSITPVLSRRPYRLFAAFSPQTFRYWRVQLTYPAPTALELARLWIGDVLELSMETSWSTSYSERGLARRGQTQAPAVVPGPRSRTLLASVPATGTQAYGISDNDEGTLRETELHLQALAALGPDAECVLIPRPDLGTAFEAVAHAKWQRHGLYCGAAVQSMTDREPLVQTQVQFVELP